MYDWQDQIVVGTVLGGASLVKPPKGSNCYLSMRGKEANWLLHKMKQLPKYFDSDPSKLHAYGNSNRCNSKCSPKLTDLHNVLYSGNKRTISMEVLDPLRDIGLAIWFIDGGGKTGRNKKNAYFNTTKYGEEGTTIVHKYFNLCGLDCTINKNGKDRWRILFDVESTERLFKTIAHHFPPFMWNRLE